MSLLSRFKNANTGSQPSHQYIHHAKEHTQDQIDRPPHTPRRITELLEHGRQQNNERFGLCHQQEEFVNIRVRKLLNPLIKSNSALDFTTLIPCSVIWTSKRADGIVSRKMYAARHAAIPRHTKKTRSRNICWLVCTRAAHKKNHYKTNPMMHRKSSVHNGHRKIPPKKL